MNLTNIIIILILLFAVYVVASYNGFIVLRNRIKEALSGIDVQLKRRTDLIPNLVSTVKGYAKQEKDVFLNVTKARSALMSAKSVSEKAKANNMITSALKSIFAVAEAYPELKSSTNFQDLQRQLEDTEDKIAYSRQFYNSNVLDYNNKIAVFPGNVIAGVFGFRENEFFQTEGEEEKKNVKVDFS